MSRRRLRTLLAASSLVLAAPSAAHAEDPAADPGTATDSALESGVADAMGALERCRISRAAPAFTELWTWTTAEQIDELRTDGKLLRRAVSSDGRRSHFDTTLERKLGRDHPLVEHLDGEDQRRRRFGWVAPWATAAGSGLERYGDQLIRVEFDEDALIAVFTPRELEPLRWVRADGSPVDDDDVDPTAVTAVYHEAAEAPWANTFGPRPSSVAPSYVYRELVLVGMAGVKRWSHGSDAARERLVADASALALVRAVLPTVREENGSDDLWPTTRTDVWSGSQMPDQHPFVTAWKQCLAFPTTPYALEDERIDDLIVRIEAVADAQSAPVDGTK